MSENLFPTYARSDIAFEAGEGVWLIDTEGRRYLDFLAGIAVNIVGHSHPHLVKAVTTQAEKIWHVSNLYRIPEQERLGERLVQYTFADKVFFCNSGSEAIELSIKTARHFHYANGEPERHRIITFEGAFHGRTLAAIAAGGNPKYTEGFGPDFPGIDHIGLEDEELLKVTISQETAAILIEPIQGEGGIRPIAPSFLRLIRQLCDEHGLLLILDEIQCGVGRSGKLFAHEIAGIEPDIMAIAKGIGGGFPLGACLATNAAAQSMTPGTHGSTFGGNPLAMAVGNAVLDIVLEEGFIDKVAAKGRYFKQRIAEVVDGYPEVFDLVRGEGLMLGIRCNIPVSDVLTAMRDQGLIAGPAGDNIIRFLPSLLVNEEEINDAISRLGEAAANLSSKS